MSFTFGASGVRLGSIIRQHNENSYLQVILSYSCYFIDTAGIVSLLLMGSPGKSFFQFWALLLAKCFSNHWTIENFNSFFTVYLNIDLE